MDQIRRAGIGCLRSANASLFLAAWVYTAKTWHRRPSNSSRKLRSQTIPAVAPNDLNRSTCGESCPSPPARVGCAAGDKTSLPSFVGSPGTELEFAL